MSNDICGYLLFCKEGLPLSQCPQFPIVFGQNISVGFGNDHDISIKHTYSSTTDVVLLVDKDTGFVRATNPDRSKETILNLQPLTKSKYLLPEDILIFRGKTFIYKSSIFSEEDIETLNKKNSTKQPRVSKWGSLPSTPLSTRLQRQNCTPKLMTSRRGGTFEIDYVSCITPSRSNLHNVTHCTLKKAFKVTPRKCMSVRGKSKSLRKLQRCTRKSSLRLERSNTEVETNLTKIDSEEAIASNTDEERLQSSQTKKEDALSIKLKRRTFQSFLEEEEREGTRNSATVRSHTAASSSGFEDFRLQVSLHEGRVSNSSENKMLEHNMSKNNISKHKSPDSTNLRNSMVENCSENAVSTTFGEPERNLNIEESGSEGRQTPDSPNYSIISPGSKPTFLTEFEEPQKAGFNLNVLTSTAQKGRTTADLIFVPSNLTPIKGAPKRKLSEPILGGQSPISIRKPTSFHEFNNKSDSNKENYGKYSTVDGSPILERSRTPNLSLTFDHTPNYEDDTSKKSINFSESTDQSNWNSEYDVKNSIIDGSLILERSRSASLSLTFDHTPNYEDVSKRKEGTSKKLSLCDDNDRNNLNRENDRKYSTTDGSPILERTRSAGSSLTFDHTPNYEDITGCKEDTWMIPKADDDNSEISGVEKMEASPKEEVFALKHLFARRPSRVSPKLLGVKMLFKRKSISNDLTDVRGVREVFKINSPPNDLTEIVGVKEVFGRKSILNDLTNVTGMKEVFRKSPKNDLLDVEGVERIFKRNNTPKNDLDDCRGVARLFRHQNTPVNDLRGVSGVGQLFEREKTPTPTLNQDDDLERSNSLFPEETVPKGQPSEDLFDNLSGRQSYKTYGSRSSFESPPEDRPKVINDGMADAFESMKKKRKLSRSLRLNASNELDRSQYKGVNLLQTKDYDDTLLTTPTLSLKHCSTPILRGSSLKKRSLVMDIDEENIGNVKNEEGEVRTSRAAKITSNLNNSKTSMSDQVSDDDKEQSFQEKPTHGQRNMRNTNNFENLNQEPHVTATEVIGQTKPQKRICEEENEQDASALKKPRANQINTIDGDNTKVVKEKRASCGPPKKKGLEIEDVKMEDVKTTRRNLRGRKNAENPKPHNSSPQRKTSADDDDKVEIEEKKPLNIEDVKVEDVRRPRRNLRSRKKVESPKPHNSLAEKSTFADIGDDKVQNKEKKNPDIEGVKARDVKTPPRRNLRGRKKIETPKPHTSLSGKRTCADSDNDQVETEEKKKIRGRRGTEKDPDIEEVKVGDVKTPPRRNVRGRKKIEPPKPQTSLSGKRTPADSDDDQIEIEEKKNIRGRRGTENNPDIEGVKARDGKTPPRRNVRGRKKIETPKPHTSLSGKRTCADSDDNQVEIEDQKKIHGRRGTEKDPDIEEVKVGDVKTPPRRNVGGRKKIEPPKPQTSLSGKKTPADSDDDQIEIEEKKNIRGRRGTENNPDIEGVKASDVKTPPRRNVRGRKKIETPKPHTSLSGKRTCADSDDNQVEIEDQKKIRGRRGTEKDPDIEEVKVGDVKTPPRRNVRGRKKIEPPKPQTSMSGKRTSADSDDDQVEIEEKTKIRGRRGTENNPDIEGVKASDVKTPTRRNVRGRKKMETPKPHNSSLRKGTSRDRYDDDNDIEEDVKTPRKNLRGRKKAENLKQHNSLTRKSTTTDIDDEECPPVKTPPRRNLRARKNAQTPKQQGDEQEKTKAPIRRNLRNKK